MSTVTILHTRSHVSFAMFAKNHIVRVFSIFTSYYGIMWSFHVVCFWHCFASTSIQLEFLLSLTMHLSNILLPHRCLAIILQSRRKVVFDAIYDFGEPSYMVGLSRTLVIWVVFFVISLISTVMLVLSDVLVVVAPVSAIGWNFESCYFRLFVCWHHRAPIWFDIIASAHSLLWNSSSLNYSLFRSNRKHIKWNLPFKNHNQLCYILVIVRS